ncbi:hypothetical protein ADUPG1_010761 [Aduncisulcus paluster]|uniref:Uncharacterized protein n=1 Tax=Aduncisulcus paluster TaxID=2918883 RepID=A0ABQ5JWA3_9EUKA|nr:hypothetical protein ADUPG1_010761 [Aduncisulcus paluster]
MARWSVNEDTILKAFVGRYGLHQWVRIASVLPRRSAKDCENRWKNFLSDKVNKTPWSKQEKLKLTKLAAQFPSQWETIASILDTGRTAHQCYVKHVELIDQIRSMDDLTELDEKPASHISILDEYKAARLDAESLFGAEKEALEEAKARLANTMGRKERRKMREKKKEETKRVTSLRRIRERVTARMGSRDIFKDVSGTFRASEIPLLHDLSLIENDEERAKRLKAKREFIRGGFRQISSNISPMMNSDEIALMHSKESARRRNLLRQLSQEQAKASTQKFPPSTVEQVPEIPKKISSKPSQTFILPDWNINDEEEESSSSDVSSTDISHFQDSKPIFPPLSHSIISKYLFIPPQSISSNIFSLRSLIFSLLTPFSRYCICINSNVCQGANVQFKRSVWSILPHPQRIPKVSYSASQHDYIAQSDTPWWNLLDLCDKDVTSVSNFDYEKSMEKEDKEMTVESDSHAQTSFFDMLRSRVSGKMSGCSKVTEDIQEDHQEDLLETLSNIYSNELLFNSFLSCHRDRDNHDCSTVLHKHSPLDSLAHRMIREELEAKFE